MDCKIFMWIVRFFSWIVRFLCGLLDLYVDCKDLKGRKFVLSSTKEYIGDISL